MSTCTKIDFILKFYCNRVLQTLDLLLCNFHIEKSGIGKIRYIRGKTIAIGSWDFSRMTVFIAYSADN